MSSMSDQTQALLDKARRARLPESSRLVPTGVEVQERIEELGSRPGLPLAPRALALAAMAVCLLAAGTVAALGIVQTYFDPPAASSENEAPEEAWEPTEPAQPRPGASRQHQSAPVVDEEPAVVEEPAALAPIPAPSPSPAPSQDQEPPATDRPEVVASTPRAPGQQPMPGPVSGPPSRVARGFEGPTRPSTEVPPSAPEALPAAATDLAPDTLAEETRLINLAQAALRGHEPRQALEHVREHRRRFPRGTLSLERAAAHLLARCQLGSTDVLRARAEQFIHRHPRSIHTSRIRSECLP